MSHYRILLLDDEVELVSTLVERLQFRDIDAQAVTNGHEALELLSQEHFDVIVADLKMPGLSGLEVFEITKKRYPDTKMILITGHGSTQDEQQTEIEGIKEILMKPFSIEDLIASIQRALHQ